MFNSDGLTRENLVDKLTGLNFQGPYDMGGHSFMLYHGDVLALPRCHTLSINQLRWVLSRVDEMISKEEWVCS